MNGGKGEQPVSKHELILKLMREVLSYRDRGLTFNITFNSNT